MIFIDPHWMFASTTPAAWSHVRATCVVIVRQEISQRELYRLRLRLPKKKACEVRPGFTIAVDFTASELFFYGQDNGACQCAGEAAALRAKSHDERARPLFEVSRGSCRAPVER